MTARSRRRLPRPCRRFWILAGLLTLIAGTVAVLDPGPTVLPGIVFVSIVVFRLTRRR